jgi:hypothetical protein
MTISQGGLIQATDYNSFRQYVSDILGPTVTNELALGYGQTVSADTPVVANSTIVSATPTTTKQWVALYNDMLKIANHQGGASKTAMDLVTTAYNNNIKAGSIIQYSDMNLISGTILTLYNNRLNIAAGQYSDELLTTSTRTAIWGSPSKTTVQHSFTVTFASSDAARYFFNAGGTIQFKPSLTGGDNTSQNNDWKAMLVAVGTVSFRYSSTASDSILGGGTPGGGFNQLSTTPLTIYTKGGNAGYGAIYANNDYTITATKNGGILTFNVYFNDDGKNGSGYYDYVNGTLTNEIRMYRPSGSNVTLIAPIALNTTELSA